MPNVGELADVLRAVGLYLDLERAIGISIENHDAYLRVGWKSISGNNDQRFFEDLDLDSLRAEAQALRKSDVRAPGGSLAEMLRTLGQELDDARVDVATIIQEQRAFWVSGQADGRYFRQVYYPENLTALSYERRRKRGETSPPNVR